MSVKPSDVGRFAAVGAVDATNIAAPSSGVRDTGFPTNAILTSGNLNYLENLAYRWRQYLNDGDIDLHFATALLLTANTVNVGGEFTVAGAANSTLGGPVTMNSGLTLAVDQNITLTGLGAYKHSDRVLSLAPHLAAVTSGTPSYAVSNISFGAAGGTLMLGIPLKSGDRIKSYTIGIFGDGAVDVTCTFVKLSASNVQTVVDTTTITNAPSSYVVTPVNPADQTIADGEFYMIQYAATGGSSNVFFGATSVKYDRP